MKLSLTKQSEETKHKPTAVRAATKTVVKTATTKTVSKTVPEKSRPRPAINFVASSSKENAVPNAQSGFQGDGETVPALVDYRKLYENKSSAETSDSEETQEIVSAVSGKPIPEYLKEFQNLDPEDYHAKFVEKCLWHSSRALETTTPEGEVTNSVKRFLCKSRRHDFCFRYLHRTRLIAMLETVPLEKNGLFITFTRDQEQLRNWKIFSPAAQVATGAMLGFVRERMQKLPEIGVRGWQSFTVTENHNSGWPHNHGVYRDVVPLATWWDVGAKRFLQDGTKRGKTQDVPPGGLWLRSNIHFFNRGFAKGVKGTGKRIPIPLQKQLYWDWKKISRYHILQGNKRGVPGLKKSIVSGWGKGNTTGLKERIRKNKGKNVHLANDYQAQLDLVLNDVPVDGCLCHPESRYYKDRDKHNIEDEYRAILASEILQVFCDEAGLGDVHVLPIFDVPGTIHYLLKEMTKEAKLNSYRPKGVPITRSSHYFFAEYEEAIDENTYRQHILKGDSLESIVSALPGSSLVGKESVKIDGKEVLFAQEYVPPDDCLIQHDRLTELLPVIKRNTRWDDASKGFLHDGDCTPRVFLKSDGMDVFTFWCGGQIIERTSVCGSNYESSRISPLDFSVKPLKKPRIRNAAKLVFGQKDPGVDEIYSIFRRVREGDIPGLLGLARLMTYQTRKICWPTFDELTRMVSENKKTKTAKVLKERLGIPVSSKDVSRVLARYEINPKPYIQIRRRLFEFSDDGVAQRVFNFGRGGWEDYPKGDVRLAALFPEHFPTPVKQRKLTFGLDDDEEL